MLNQARGTLRRAPRHLQAPRGWVGDSKEPPLPSVPRGQLRPSEGLPVHFIVLEDRAWTFTATGNLGNAAGNGDSAFALRPGPYELLLLGGDGLSTV